MRRRPHLWEEAAPPWEGEVGEARRPAGLRPRYLRTRSPLGYSASLPASSVSTTDEDIVCKVSYANQRPILFLPGRRKNEH